MPKFVFTFSSISKEDERYLEMLLDLDDQEINRDYDVRVYDGTNHEFYSWGLMLTTPGKMYYYEEKNLYVSAHDEAVVTVHENDFERFKLEHPNLSRK